MRCDAYFRRGVVFIPTLGKVEEGFYREIEPVAVVRVDDAEGLRRAFEETVRRGNPPLPHLRRADYPEPILLKHAGLKSWASFERGTSTWSIREKDNDYQIVGSRKGPHGGWEDDPEQLIQFPSGTNSDAVIERMILVLQRAAKP